MSTANRCDVCWHIASSRAIHEVTTTEDEYEALHHLIHGPPAPLPDQTCEGCGQYLLSTDSPGYEPHTCPPNTGHGHVRPRPDGARARCGGPPMCKTCRAEQVALTRGGA